VKRALPILLLLAAGGIVWWKLRGSPSASTGSPDDAGGESGGLLGALFGNQETGDQVGLTAPGQAPVQIGQVGNQTQVVTNYNATPTAPAMPMVLVNKVMTGGTPMWGNVGIMLPKRWFCVYRNAAGEERRLETTQDAVCALSFAG
jgi:hypothetical protein